MANNWSLKAVIWAQDNLSPALRNITRAASVTRKSLADFGNSAGRLGSNISGVLGPLGAVTGLMSAGGIAAGVGAVIKTTSAFEKMQTTLETIEGSAAKAKASMGWVSDFATRTPYEVDEVTQSFVKLKAYGIDPQNGALEAAGNAASAMGKPLMQAVEAIADAMTGENERLKEFGITSKKVGDDVVYRWVENGRKMAAKVNASNQSAIEQTIKGIWSKRFGGGMDKQAQTFDGIVSNLKDTWTRFLLTIGQSGIFDVVKGQLSGLLAQLNAWSEDGTIKRVATEISNGLVGAFRDLVQWVNAVDWRAAWRELGGYVESVRTAIAAVGGLKGAILILAGIMAAQALAPIVSMTAALLRMGTGLTALTAQLLLPNAALATLTTQMTLANLATNTLKASMLQLGAVAAAGVGGYALGGVINDQITGLLERTTGVQGMSLGSWIYDKVNGGQPRADAPTPLPGRGGAPGAPGAGPSLLQAGRSQSLNGEIKVSFDNAPPGMRVEPGRTNQGVRLNPDVGYGASAMGLP